MLRNYFITAWRNLARHKMYAAIHVFGLALGASACLIIYLIVSFELSFDKFHPDKERIYRVVTNLYTSGRGEEHSGCIPDPAPFAIREEISGLESVVLFRNHDASVTIQQNGDVVKKFERPKRGQEHSDIVIAEPQYFDVFHYSWLCGNAAALKEPFTVVLTESKAKLYFGDHAPAEILNRLIVYNDSLHVKVVGVVKDADNRTDFYFRDFISFSTMQRSFLKNDLTPDDWAGWHTNAQVFVKLAKNVQAADINKQLVSFVRRHTNVAEDTKMAFRLQPLSAIHFDARYEDAYSRKAHLPTLYGLMAVALFILVIAVINFITLSIAQSVDRLKETGIRKICGSSRRALILRFMGETFILTLLAVSISVLSVRVLLSAFRSFIPDGVTFPFFDFSTWAFLLILAVFTTLIAGIYPARVLSSVAPVISLVSSDMQKGNRSAWFIKGLIVFQFTISLVFIIGTLVVSKQMLFMMNKDLGFNKDAIITVQTNEGYPAARKELLAEKLRQLPEVDVVSVSEGTPVAKLHWFNPLTYKGKEERGTATIAEWGDAHFVPLYNIRLVAGRNVLPSDSIREFLVNEMCAKALGFANAEDAIGKMVETMTPGGPVSRPIVGVMADFHSQSLHEPVMPVVFTTHREFTRLINIKLQTKGKQMSDLNMTIAKIEKCWKEIYPHDPFSYDFFDETIRKFYEKERKTARLMTTAMAVSICIACLGLFGMASLTVRRRTKEIGIRKMLGAGVAQIVFILSKDTVRLVLIAIVVATPIAWYAMNQWLNNFAYHTTVGWWMGLLAGIIVLLIAFCTISYQSIKAAMANPVNSLKAE